MLGKLLKYDFRAIFKKIWFVFPAVPALALLARLMLLLGEHYKGSTTGTVVSLFSGLSVTGAVVMMLFAVIFAYIVCIIRFIGSMTRDEAYLTHTLPVTPTALVFSKLISSFVMMLAVLAVCACGGLIILAQDGLLDAAREIFVSVLPSMFGMSSGICIFYVALLVVVSLLYYLTMVYACVSLGQMHARAKIGFAFMYGGIIYLVTQICSLVFMFAVLGMTIETETMSTAYINASAWYGVCFSAVLVAAFIVITTLVFSKRKNLE